MTLQNVCICDTETGGIDAAIDPLVEVAAAVWSIEYGCLISAWSGLVIGDSNNAETVNRIPVGALRRGVGKVDAIANLRAYAGRCDVVAAHRCEFDRSFVGELGTPWVCTKFDCEWGGGVKLGASLVETCLALGVGVTHNHRAITDVLLLTKCFEALYLRVGADGVRAMLIRALRPKAKYAALVSYDDKEKAKIAGFKWEPEGKRWLRTMAREDVEKLPFRVMEVP